MSYSTVATHVPETACETCRGSGACDGCDGYGTTLPALSDGWSDRSNERECERECEMCQGNGTCAECAGNGTTATRNKETDR